MKGMVDLKETEGKYHYVTGPDGKNYVYDWAKFDYIGQRGDLRGDKDIEVTVYRLDELLRIHFDNSRTFRKSELQGELGYMKEK